MARGWIVLLRLVSATCPKQNHSGCHVGTSAPPSFQPELNMDVFQHRVQCATIRRSPSRNKVQFAAGQELLWIMPNEAIDRDTTRQRMEGAPLDLRCSFSPRVANTSIATVMARMAVTWKAPRHHYFLHTHHDNHQHKRREHGCTPIDMDHKKKVGQPTIRLLIVLTRYMHKPIIIE